MQNQKLQNFNLVNWKFSCKKASKQANEQKLKKKILKRNKQKKIVKKVKLYPFNACDSQV